VEQHISCLFVALRIKVNFLLFYSLPHQFEILSNINFFLLKKILLLLYKLCNIKENFLFIGRLKENILKRIHWYKIENSNGFRLLNTYSFVLNCYLVDHPSHVWEVVPLIENQNSLKLFKNFVELSFILSIQISKWKKVEINLFFVNFWVIETCDCWFSILFAIFHQVLEVNFP